MKKYNLAILILYTIITPWILIFYPVKFYAGSQNSGWGVLAAIAGLFIFYFLNLWLGWIELSKRTFPTDEFFFMAAYAFAIAIPEELIFRGMIQSYFSASFQNAAVAVIFSSMVFGLAHLPNRARGIHPLKWNWRFAGLAFAAGLLFGFLYSLTGSLLVPVLLHAFILIFLQAYAKAAFGQEIGR